jgi:hypothetical protein
MTGWLPRFCRATLTLALAGAVIGPFGASADQSGVDYDCTDFENQADAQAFFEEMGGPLNDPYNLDDDADGEACEEWMRGYDRRPNGDLGNDELDRDCADFDSQAEAQRYFLRDGGSPQRNVDHLDLNGNGVACEEGEPG